ncbi:hypothetical protein CYMTET_19059 [Cymbomonas tetramitiformis]|uniref:Protein kinase domain-containing protein n=1 Tax=Cymbomonas tetramitiformis TaxID=36881 RepID=A0AAE0G863_9CHLO|nr:hypothetical protein CYMTET_19059 [Cymbomonas tetramitiformis]
MRSAVERPIEEGASPPENASRKPRRTIKRSTTDPIVLQERLFGLRSNFDDYDCTEERKNIRAQTVAMECLSDIDAALGYAKSASRPEKGEERVPPSEVVEEDVSAERVSDEIEAKMEAKLTEYVSLKSQLLTREPRVSSSAWSKLQEPAETVASCEGLTVQLEETFASHSFQEDIPEYIVGELGRRSLLAASAAPTEQQPPVEQPHVTKPTLGAKPPPLFVPSSTTGAGVQVGEWTSSGTWRAVKEQPPALPSTLQQIDGRDIEQVKELGRGHFSSVFLSRWLGVEVAVKELNVTSDKETNQETFKEAEILAGLRHPCIIALYGVVVAEDGGLAALVLEYIRGGSLREGLQSLRKQVCLARCAQRAHI